MAKSKLHKGILKQAKKAAKEAGNELISNKSEIREAAKEVRRAARECTEEKPSIKWNLSVGDLIEISRTASYVPDGIRLGCIVAVDTSRARNIKDWSQNITVMTKVGKISFHPRFATVIQKA